MPKKIDGVESAVLCAARELLLKESYAGVTMRAVSEEAGVAVGTVYNYFPSKDILVARVMERDWNAMLEDMKEKVASVESALEGLRTVDGELRSFVDTYRIAWRGYTIPTGSQEYYRERHKALVTQLADLIRPLLVRFDALFAEEAPVFFAGNLLSLATSESVEFQSLEPILIKLLQ